MIWIKFKKNNLLRVILKKIIKNEIVWYDTKIIKKLKYIKKSGKHGLNQNKKSWKTMNKE